LPTDAPRGEDRPAARVERTPSGSFGAGFLVAALPLALLVLPLFFHRSSDPAYGAYSARYLALLVGVCAAAGTTALAVAWACRRSGGTAPAWGLVLSLAAAVFTCGALEMVLSYRLSRTDTFAQYSAWGHKRSMLFAFEAAPNNTWVNAGATYSTDEFGFRTHARGPWQDGAGPRVFTIGESSVFGYGLGDDQTWPHRLEGLLRAQTRDDSLVVVNAGNNGHTSLQTLFRFHARVLPHQPTHVILYLGPNDVYGMGQDHLMISEDILFSSSVAEYWAGLMRGKNPYTRSLLYFVAQQYVPQLAVDVRQEAEPSGPKVVYDATEADAIARRYLENVRTICLIARAHGVEPIVVTFIHDMPPGVTFPPLVIDNANARLRDYARAEHVTLVDLASAFDAVPDKARYFFQDHYHPNAEGAELIATTIAASWR
jgi:lysophospholipase L1-like esterase